MDKIKELYDNVNKTYSELKSKEKLNISQKIMLKQITSKRNKMLKTYPELKK